MKMLTSLKKGQLVKQKVSKVKNVSSNFLLVKNMYYLMQYVVFTFFIFRSAKKLYKNSKLY